MAEPDGDGPFPGEARVIVERGNNGFGWTCEHLKLGRLLPWWAVARAPATGLLPPLLGRQCRPTSVALVATGQAPF